MPSLSELYRDLSEETVAQQTGLYRVTNTPWIAANTPDEPFVLRNEDYTRIITITIGHPSNPLRVIWPFKLFCQNSLFFRNICMPSTPIIPDTTPNYIRILRQQFQTTASIPFPYTTPKQCDAFSIFLSWNTHEELKQAKKFAGITSTNIDQRLAQYIILWDQLLECYKLSQFLIAPKFANKIIDTMILALKEEPSFQTKRRNLHVQDHENPYMPNNREEYESTMHALTLNEHKDNQHAENWIVTGIPPFGAWNALSPGSRYQILRRPTLAPDTRHVLGATPRQIAQLYADTNPGSRLRALIVDMIFLYSTHYPRYYGQNGGFGELLGGAEVGVEGEMWVPMEFVRDLLARFARGSSSRGNRGARLAEDVDPCSYHDHRHGAVCPRKPVLALDNLQGAANANADAVAAAAALLNLHEAGNGVAGAGNANNWGGSWV
ncbi:hypothetical protein EYC80_003556 [Monilinia laxa]|uniref:Uncharacterized protein n=1 Tax=Monilinia laxa TaxID=61186 RepID=A0A5N6KK15_MONLA|nr:hypothetical protein EYC80_003556 [Monilinia laxa]